jgi:hypothetical protein
MLWRAIQPPVVAARDGTPWSGCDELELSRQDQRATSPDNRDTALLQRLAQSLQHVPPEFRQLVEEEHAPVDQRSEMSLDTKRCDRGEVAS